MKKIINHTLFARGPVHCCHPRDLSEKLRQVVGEKVCTIATCSSHGQPECAVVGFALGPEGELILHTHKYSRKWMNLRENPEVAISITAGIHAPYFQIEGTAELIDADGQRELLEDIYLTEHPKAAALANRFETGCVLIRPNWARHFEWPRKTGRCTEWMVSRSLRPSAGPLVLRHNYDEDEKRIWRFLEQNPSPMFGEAPHDLRLLAEEGEAIVGLLEFRHVPSVGLIMVGPLVANCDKGAGVSLVRMARHVVHSTACLALPANGYRQVFKEAGFSELPKGDRRGEGFARLLENEGGHCGPMAVNWPASRRGGGKRGKKARTATKGEGSSGVRVASA